MHHINALIAAERRAVTRYTFLLALRPRSRYAARWRGLRAWHEGQIKRWREKL